MKKTPWLSFMLLLGLLPSAVSAVDPPDFAVNVTASDGGCSISQVQLYLNVVTATTPVAVDTASPYQLTIPKALLAVDPLRIIVRAIDKSGRSSQAEVTVHPILVCVARTTR